MCKLCQCENELKCSVKGYQPLGWCCKYCIYYSETVICKQRFAIVASGQKPRGHCLGCENEDAQLIWLYHSEAIGFCDACLSKYKKMELLNIVVKKSETQT